MVRRVRERLVIVHAAQLDVVFRRYHDLGVDVDAVVAAAEFGAPLREDRLVVVGARSVG